VGAFLKNLSYEKRESFVEAIVSANALLSLPFFSFRLFLLEMASRPVLEAFEAKRIALEVGSKVGCSLVGRRAR